MKVSSSDSCEWYTPPELLHLVYQVMSIDLDPCSPDVPTVDASNFFTKKDDGLLHDWFGNVFLNPPYGRGIGRWIEKLVSEYQSGKVLNAIVLIPGRTDTKWFAELVSHVDIACFITGRVSFIEPSGLRRSGGMFPSIICFLSRDFGKMMTFTHVFSSIGSVWSKLEPSEELHSLLCGGSE